MKINSIIKNIYPELTRYRETVFVCNNGKELQILYKILVNRYDYYNKYSDTRIGEYRSILTLNAIRSMNLLPIGSVNIEHPNVVKFEDIINYKSGIY